MGPLTEAEELLPPDHPISQNIKTMKERFGGGGDFLALKIAIHFGVQGIDKEGVSSWKSG
jgi:predicted RND superfamily exporter protein